ncbi:HTH_Tnp_Tc3_2 domain-containing protein [Trichonephila clavipes]|nr:HTH_Tnp_Tc3_2 domain-containing protein [Trichonephila clavipes]
MIWSEISLGGHKYACVPWRTLTILSTGRPRVRTPSENWYLAVTDKRNRRIPSSDLSHQLSSATGTTVLRQTMYRRLGHIVLYARRPVGCVPFTATHCRLRLTWSKEHYGHPNSGLV